MKLSPPLVSIVMPSLNQVNFIGRAIDSVLNQSYQNIELIISDGYSEDGTLELLAKKQTQDARLKWSSSKDTGAAQAINKALLKVRGTVIGWLNSDDLYSEGSIARAVDYFNYQADCLLLYGRAQHIDEQGCFIDDYPTSPPPTSIQDFKQGCFICQPSVFFQRSLFILLGQLNENLKTAFDFDYWLRAFSTHSERIGFIDHVQALSRLHPNCMTQRMRRTVTLESMQVLSKYLGVAPVTWVLSYIDELIEKNKKSDILLTEINSITTEAKQYLAQQDLDALNLILKKRFGKIEQ